VEETASRKIKTPPSQGNKRLAAEAEGFADVGPRLPEDQV
jgi:hypothetical protein